MKLLACLLVLLCCMSDTTAVRTFIYQRCITEAAVQTCREHAKEWGIDFGTKMCK
ncbi:hypothetical protein MTO96_034378, partial [Rhipicephalus appendiculatus]